MKRIYSDSGTPRPHIPLAIRLEVALRQLAAVLGSPDLELDHSPPLAAREKVIDKNGEIVGYIPPANDPRFLIYRTDADHKRKTYLRGDGAQFSDTVLIKRERRREKRENGTARPKAKISQRANPWPKGRGFYRPPTP